jgi:uncharacterized protein (DUF697 family)
MTADEKADMAIKAMIMTVIGTAAIPAHVNWAVTGTAMGAGVIAIGACYGVELTKDEAWHLIRQFVSAAGFWFVSMAVGSKIISVILASTGIGYVGAVAIDGFVSAAFAYAIGGTAKAYFKGVKNQKELGKVFKAQFKTGQAQAQAKQKRG